MSLSNFFIRNIFLPMSDLFLSRSVSKNLRFLNRSQWWSSEDIRTFQNERLRHLIEHAYINVPYYNEVFKENNLKPSDIKSVEDLIKLPILTKDIIKKNFPQSIVAKNIPNNQMILQSSSGSTGEPLQYMTTRDAYSFNVASVFRSWSWAGYHLGDRFLKISVNPRVGILKKLEDYFLRCKYTHSQSMSPKDIEYIVDLIRNSKFILIRTYPSTFYVLAEHIKNNKVKDVNVKSLVSTGETILPNIRKFIETQFNCKVFDGYSGEAGANVSQCEDHSYHVSDEFAFTEVVQDEDQMNCDGLGNITSTNLWNYATPFIRYNVMDIAKMSGTICACGRGLSVIDKIEGRDADVLITPSNRRIVVHYFTGYFEWVESVDQFQVIQTKRDQITVKLIPNNKFNSYEGDKIKNDLGKTIGDDVRINLEFVDDIQLTRSGKRRFVIRDFSLNHN